MGDNYFDDLPKFIEKLEVKGEYIGIDEGSSNTKEFVKDYIKEHSNRFLHGIKMLDKVVKNGDTIYELGSPYPFFSYYFYITKNCKVVCGDIYDRKWKYDDRMTFTPVDLCKLESIGHNADIIIVSEVLEHLTCDIFKLRDILANSCKYLLITVPLGNIGDTVPLDCTLEVQNCKFKAFNHLREFGGRDLQLIGDNTLIEYRRVNCGFTFDMGFLLLKCKGD